MLYIQCAPSKVETKCLFCYAPVCVLARYSYAYTKFRTWFLCGDVRYDRSCMRYILLIDANLVFSNVDSDYMFQEA